MRPQLSILVILLFTQGLMAQDFDADMDSEIDQVADQASDASSMDGDRISESRIYQNPSNSRKVKRQMNKQPVTYVEATPLSDSRADQIRRSRQDAELETEQKIVEKLENSRMEDEKRRAQILFGDKILSNTNAQPVPAPAPVQEVKVVQDPIKVELVQQEVKMAAEDELTKGKDLSTTSFFSGLVGFGEYPSVSNVKSNFDVGFSYGKTYNEKLVIEGSFIYSSFSIDSYAPASYAGYGYSYNTYNNYSYGYTPYSYNPYSYVPAKIDVRQYSGQLSSKYRFADGIIKPTLGGVLQYAYREYSWTKSNYSYSYYYNNQSANTHAIDGAVSLGADFEFDSNFIISLDYRYFKNLMSSTKDNRLYDIYSPQAQNPLEKLDYYNVILSLKVSL